MGEGGGGGERSAILYKIVEALADLRIMQKHLLIHRFCSNLQCIESDNELFTSGI